MRREEKRREVEKEEVREKDILTQIQWTWRRERE